MDRSPDCKLSRYARRAVNGSKSRSKGAISGCDRHPFPDDSRSGCRCVGFAVEAHAPLHGVKEAASSDRRCIGADKHDKTTGNGMKWRISASRGKTKAIHLLQQINRCGEQRDEVQTPSAREPCGCFENRFARITGHDRSSSQGPAILHRRRYNLVIHALNPSLQIRPDHCFSLTQATPSAALSARTVSAAMMRSLNFCIFPVAVRAG